MQVPFGGSLGWHQIFSKRVEGYWQPQICSCDPFRTDCPHSRVFAPNDQMLPGQASAFHAAEAHHQMLGRQERDKSCPFVCVFSESKFRCERNCTACLSSKGMRDQNLYCHFSVCDACAVSVIIRKAGVNKDAPCPNVWESASRCDARQKFISGVARLPPQGRRTNTKACTEWSCSAWIRLMILIV